MDKITAKVQAFIVLVLMQIVRRLLRNTILRVYSNMGLLIEVTQLIKYDVISPSHRTVRTIVVYVGKIIAVYE